MFVRGRGVALVAFAVASIGVSGAARSEPDPAPPLEAPVPERPPPEEPVVGGWVDAGGGVGTLHLHTLAVDRAAQRIAFVDADQTGPVVSAGAGIRLSVVYIGPRFQLMRADRFDVWSIGGEASVRVPLSIIVPHVDVAVGRLATANIQDEDSVAHGIAESSGYYARIGGGIGVRLWHYVELDAKATWELFALGPNGPTTGDLEQAVGALRQGGLNEVWAMGQDLGGIGYGTQLTFSGSARLRF